MLDKKDRRILYELDKNARIPLSKIAKRVRLSREAVLYRTRRYLSEGIIRKYLTVINLAKIGYIHYKIYLVLHNIREEEEKEFIDCLSKDSHIGWISSCDGKYSLIFTILAKSLIELNEKIKEINKKYGKYILEMEIVPIIEAYHFYRDYIVQKAGATERRIFRGGEKEDIALDPIDAGILDLLSDNSRIGAVNIANSLGIHADVILKRIKRLEAAGIIKHYMLWPDVNKLTGNYYKVLVKLSNVDKELENKLYAFCQNDPHIVYIVYCLAPWQWEMDIEVAATEEFRKIIRRFLNEFSSSVSQYTALNIYQEYKFKFFDKRMIIFKS